MHTADTPDLNPSRADGKSESVENPSEPVTEPSGPSLPYEPALDGLRAVAVSLVMWHHVPYLFNRTLPSPSEPSDFSPDVLTQGLHALPFFRWSLAGGLGVDLFFALSGYLITRILWQSRTRARPLVTFWMRRLLRIQPLFYLYLALIGVLVYLTGWLQPLEPMPRGWDAALSYGLYLGNVHLSLNPEPSGLLVLLWSLAVEEQFYLLWPLVALKLSWHQLRRLSLGLLLLTPWLRLLVAGTLGLKAVRALPFTHADPLLMGALLALLVESPAHRAWSLRLCRRLLPVSLLLLGLYILGPFSAPDFTPTWLVMSRYTVLGVLCTVLVGATVAGSASASPGLPASRLTRVWDQLLQYPALVWMGRRSYGIYLWHWLVGEILWRLLPLKGLSPLGLTAYVLSWVALTLLVSAVSWQCFEAPLLKLKRHFDYQT